MNYSLCNQCKKLAPSKAIERDGRVYLVKECPDCGVNETLISGQADRYWEKRNLDEPFPRKTCKLNCLSCDHRQNPTLVFVDVTNRCNMNCPICINNTPSMGFLFEPPIEYFEKIFKHFAACDPKPAIQLFGGEPTVRRDLFDIIALARSCGLSARVVTNGLKLADAEYCRRLVKSRATVLIAYDGDNPALYRELRGTEKALELKQKAIENLRNTPRAKVTLMTLVAREYNQSEIRDLAQFAHDRREIIRAIYLMPLNRAWDEENWDYDPGPFTTEDVESLFDKAFPDEKIHFMPAGFLGQIPTLQRTLKVRPLPFVGAHPNCESVHLLVSNGKEYVPLSHFASGPLTNVIHALSDAEKRFARRMDKMESSLFGRFLGSVGLKAKFQYILGILTVLSALRPHVSFRKLLKGSGLGKIGHFAGMVLKLALGRKPRNTLAEHTNFQGVLQVVILPFEDRFNVETDRLERCPAVFAFVDPENDKVKSMPVCAWGFFKNDMMRRIAEEYGREGNEEAGAAETPGAPELETALSPTGK